MPPITRDLSVGVVGAGRVGTALGLALSRAGYRLVGVSARSTAARDRARELLPGVPLLPPAAVAQASDILLLTVNDDAIEPVAGELVAAGSVHNGQYVLHVSGAHGLAVLRPATAVGAIPGAIHPAMTFPGRTTDVDNLAGSAFAVTAPDAVRPAMEQFVRNLGGVPVWVADADRTLYHAGLVLGANNLITLIAAAMQALAAAGVQDPSLVLGPLVRGSLENALRLGDAALTGPVRRGDTGTVAAHIEALAEHTPDLVASYLQFGLATARRARAAGLADAAAVDRVITLLDNQIASRNDHAARQVTTPDGEIADR